MSTLISAGIPRKGALRVMGPVPIFRCKLSGQGWNERTANVLKGPTAAAVGRDG
ncbi:hypothetical protein SB717_35980 [Priestia sp. SIMBA_032]|uniref:hypothetical protein n=1 Tax=Priestia sp. SIMBA_032 TaxID=3085775 RepID=UPI00397B480D